MGKDNGGAGLIGNTFLGGVDFLHRTLGHPDDLGNKANVIMNNYKDNSNVAINAIRSGFEKGNYSKLQNEGTSAIGLNDNSFLGKDPGKMINVNNFIPKNTTIGSSMPDVYGKSYNMKDFIPKSTTEAGVMPNVYGESYDYPSKVNEQYDTLYNPNAESTVMAIPGYTESNYSVPEELGIMDKARNYISDMDSDQQLASGIGAAGLGILGMGALMNRNKNYNGGNEMNGNYGRIKQAALMGNVEAQQEVNRVEGLGVDFLVKQALLGNAEASNILDGLEIAFGAGFVKEAQMEELGIEKEASLADFLPGGTFGERSSGIPGNQFLEATNQMKPTVNADAGYDYFGQSTARMLPHGATAGVVNNYDAGYNSNGQSMASSVPREAMMGGVTDNYDAGYDPNGPSMSAMIPHEAELGGTPNAHGFFDPMMSAINDHPYAAAGMGAAGAAAAGYGAYRAMRPKTASFTNAEVRAVEMAAGLLANNERQVKIAKLARDPKVAEIAGMILRGEIK